MLGAMQAIDGGGQPCGQKTGGGAGGSGLHRSESSRGEEDERRRHSAERQVVRRTDPGAAPMIQRAGCLLALSLRCTLIMQGR